MPIGPARNAAWGSQSTTSAGSSSVVGDVGRVAHDQVEATLKDAGSASNHEPTASRTRVPGAAQAGEIRAGDVDSIGGRDQSPTLRPPCAPCDRQRDGARTRAEVATSRGPSSRPAIELRERVLDDDLGLGSGNQHPTVDEEVQLTKRPVAQDVLQVARLSPTSEHGVEMRDTALRRRRVEHQCELVPDRRPTHARRTAWRQSQVWASPLRPAERSPRSTARATRRCPRAAMQASLVLAVGGFVRPRSRRRRSRRGRPAGPCRACRA